MGSSPPPPSAILARVREEVRARRKAVAESDDVVVVRNTLERELRRCAEQLEYTRVVSSHWPLTGTTLVGRLWAFIQRGMRFLLRWYINPIVDQQNAFNEITTRTLRLLIDAYSDLLDQATTLRTNLPKEGLDDHVPPPLSPDLLLLPPDLLTETLQRLVEEHREAPAAFPDVALRTQSRLLEPHGLVNAHWPLEGRGMLQRGIALIQKAIRFALRWLINPIVEQQNSFNAAVMEAIPLLLKVDGEVRAMLATQRASVAALRRTNNQTTDPNQP